MKKTIIATLGAALILGICSCGSGINATPRLNNATDSLSYSLGLMQGTRLADAKATGMHAALNALDEKLYLKGFADARNFNEETKSYYMGLSDGMQMKNNLDNMSAQYDVEMNFEEFLVAYSQALLGDTAFAISKERLNEVCDSLFTVVRVAKEQAELDSISATPEAIANLEAGRAFLAAKEQEEGVMKTQSGLLYKVVKEGNGETFKPSQFIELGYVGKFINDTVFDQNSSIKSQVSRFVPGFTEGLQLMSPGAKYILYIPSELAYGIRGNEVIPSNSTLIFEVETKGEVVR